MAVKYRSVFLLALLILLAECASAQIKIIPRQRIDSINNVATIVNSPMRFLKGDRVKFDTIAEEQGPWQSVVEWVNDGDKTIVINEIKSSCGCLRAQSDKRTVRSGERASITLRYFPKGHPGRVSQRLFIFTSIDERKPTAVIHLSGYVKISANRQADYPKSRGGLLLRQDEVLLDGNGLYRVACYNATNRELRLSADTLFSAKGVAMRTEPEVLKPNMEGDMVIVCNEKRVNDGDKLYINGLQLPLRDRAIMLRKSDKKE